MYLLKQHTFRAYQQSYTGCINDIRRHCRHVYFKQILSEKYNYDYGDDYQLNLKCKPSYKRKICRGMPVRRSTTTSTATSRGGAGQGESSTRDPWLGGGTSSTTGDGWNPETSTTASTSYKPSIVVTPRHLGG